MENTIVIDKLTIDMITHISKIRQMVINGLVMDMNTIHYVPNTINDYSSIFEKEIKILVEILRSFSVCDLKDSNIEYTGDYIAINLISTNEKYNKINNKFINTINSDAQISHKVNDYMLNSDNATNLAELNKLYKSNKNNKFAFSHR